MEIHWKWMGFMEILWKWMGYMEIFWKWMGNPMENDGKAFEILGR